MSAIAISALALAVVFLQPFAGEPKLRQCGHADQKSLEEVMLSCIGASVRHHCSSTRAIADLRMLYIAQSIHEGDTGTNATTLEELEKEFPAKRNRLGLVLIPQGTNWNARIAQQNQLAGHYLLTSAGRLHFNTTRPATTNDFVLQNWSR